MFNVIKSIVRTSGVVSGTTVMTAKIAGHTAKASYESTDIKGNIVNTIEAVKQGTRELTEAFNEGYEVGQITTLGKYSTNNTVKLLA